MPTYKVEVANGWTQELQDLCEEAIRNVPYLKVTPQPEVVQAQIRDLTTCDLRQGVMFVLTIDGKPVGVLAARVMDTSPLIHGWKIAHEMGWYVTPSHRGHSLMMIEEFEKWAQLTGAQAVTLSHFSDDIGNRLAEVYKKKGYAPSEVAYVKVL